MTEPLVTPLVTLGTRAPRPLLRTSPEDRYFDYCLQPYAPRRPTAGKLRSENLLWNSFDVAGASPPLADAVRAIQSAAGRDMTVFGVKHMHGQLWWELYFYDPKKEDARVRASSLLDTCAPWFSVDARVRETIPYFMFSLDLKPDTVEVGRVDLLNLYLPYFQVQGGRSYKLSGDRLEFDNIYRFLHPKLEVRHILHEIKSSVFVDYSRVPLSRALLPELFACNRICVAKKRFADAVYYSGIDIDQFLWFLRRFAYPAPIVAFVDGNRSQLDHLRFDVGIDFTMDEAGDVVTTKSSYYGTV